MPQLTDTISLHKQFPSEWNSYRAAKYRCTGKNASDYAYYGGRGIEFRLGSFADFLATMGEKPTPKYTLERNDVNGHYERGNVRWATRLEQGNNMRRNRLLTVSGRTQTIAQWAREVGTKRRNIDFRLAHGWCLNCVISTNVKTCTHGYDSKAVYKISSRNRKNNVFIYALGRNLVASEWSEITGLKYTTIRARIEKRGWCNDCAVSLPTNKTKCEHKIIQKSA